jgi:DNA-3-methyladenine glycosylase I
MELERCPWCVGNPLYETYHDTEWGTPVWDDRIHFEFLVLESAQAGLSWITILRKREAFRRAYAGFDWEKVGRYGEKEKEVLLANAGIIRNRKKIEASLVNARRFQEVRDQYGSFARYLWGFVDGRPVVGHWKSLEEVPSRTELSDRIAKDLKLRGFQFIGSVIVYSHLQATGIVNDHLETCFRYRELLAINRRG